MKKETNYEWYEPNSYENYLESLLKDKKINSIFINGEFGAGKTSMLNYVIDTKINGAKTLTLDVYAQRVDTNFNDYLYDTLKEQENQLWRFIKDYANYLSTALTTVLLTIAAIVLQIDSNYAIIMLLLISLVYLIVSSILSFLKSSNRKKQYVEKKLKKIDYLIIDDLDRVYFQNSEVLNLVHYLYNFACNNKIKLILIGCRYNFKHNSVDTGLSHNLLEKYCEVDFEIPIDIVRDKQISKLFTMLYEVPYDDEDDLSLISRLLKEQSTRNIIKLNNELNNLISNEQSVVRKLYRSDVIFICLMYQDKNIQIEKMLNEFQAEFTGMALFWKYREFQNIHEKYLELSSKYELPLQVSEYLEKTLKYCFESHGRSSYVLGKHRFYNRIFDNPQYYKKNSYTTDENSPEQLINSFVYDLHETPEKITKQQFYYYYNSSVKSEEVISEVIIKCEENKPYAKKLASAVHYVIPENDSRIKYNLKYYWLTDRSGDYRDMGMLEKINNFLDENIAFKDLNPIIQLEILEREVHSGNKKYCKSLSDEVIKLIIREMIHNDRPFKFFEIFGTNKKFASEVEIINLTKSYFNWMKMIKEKYNYYVDNPGKGKRTDEGDKELIAFDEFKRKTKDLYGIPMEEFVFSFDD